MPSFSRLASILAATTLVAAQDYGYSPPVYPSPESMGLTWEAAFAQAEAFVSKLTLQEKAMMVTGTPGPCTGNIAPIERLGFNGLCLQDGPLAIRPVTFATVFPAGLTTAASFDKSLMHTRGMYLGAEFRGKGSHIALGPVSGPLGRNALGGRNWEGFSPDPYLTGVAMTETVTGMQSSGVQACAKHYIGNEQETQRNPSTDAEGVTIDAISSNIDDRTIHELYIWPFANAVHSGVSSIMCSYNRINGSYGCANSKTLNGILKTELGFQGYVMSDWEAVHTGVPAIEAGLDMNMPGGIEFLTDIPSYFGGNITIAVNNGSLTEARVDDMIKRIMTPYFQLGQNVNYPAIDPTSAPLTFFPPPYNHSFVYGQPFVDVRANHATLVRELGAAGMVLLKNENNALPIQKPRFMAIFGNDAGPVSDGLSGSLTSSSFGFEYGNLVVGGGSGTGRLTYLVTPLDALQAKAKEDGTNLQYLLNNDIISGPTSSSVFGITFAAGVATTYPVPDVCLVFLKTFSAEGNDRLSLVADWNSTYVVENVASICNNTIVITNSAGLNVLPWADNPNVTAIVAAHLSGQESGNSLVDILYGAVNPSGKLPYTIAKNESDYSYAMITNSTALLETTDPNAWQSNFTEGLLIDYRHFDYYNVSVQYEFGYGLSYTTFDISSLQISGALASLASAPTGTILPGGHADLWNTVYAINVTVTNTGSIFGSAVPQLYVEMPQIAGEDPTPIKQLRGFEKIGLQPGESKTVGFDLMRRDISYWSTGQQQWLIPSGSIGIKAGFSSRDLKLSGSIQGAT